MADVPAGTVSPEIAKLSEKLQKEPGSKIFFNLAEEYFKGGMLEEALIVLQTGLKVHPSYLGAKVLLGKVYAGQNKVKEAKELFEQILKVNPDNLIVNKKLALIYFDDKLFNEAEKCCNQVLFFSSKDADAITLLQKIKEGRTASEPRPPEVKFPEPPPLPAVTPEISETPVNRIEIAQSAKEIEPPSEALISVAPPVTEEVSLNGKKDDNGLEKPEPENQFDFADIMKEEVKAPPARSGSSEKGEGRSKENLETMALAELYIKQGHYQKGIEIYQKLLDQDPYNETVRQQLEDARTIGNLLGLKNEPEQIEKDILETIMPPQEEPSLPVQTTSSPVNSRNQSRIARLRQWLEILKNNH